jgi:hypothetical protein
LVSGREGLALVKMLKESPRFDGLDVVVLSGADVEREVEKLGAVFAGTRLYLLNEILREKSGLYKQD